MNDNKEVLKNEEMENVKTEETAVTTVQDLNSLARRTDTKSQIFTNITDKKKMFN